MQVETRNKILSAIVTALLFGGIYLLVRYLVEHEREQVEYQVEQCLANTADPAWCYEKLGLPAPQ